LAQWRGPALADLVPHMALNPARGPLPYPTPVVRPSISHPSARIETRLG
jgi:hypothetical protein